MEDLDKMEKEVFILSYTSANNVYNISECEDSKIDTVKSMYLIMNQDILATGDSLKEVMDYLLDSFSDIIMSENVLGFFEGIDSNDTSLNIIFFKDGRIAFKELFSAVVKNFGKTTFNIKSYLFKKFSTGFIRARRFSLVDGLYYTDLGATSLGRCYLKENSIKKLSNNLKILSYDVFQLSISNENNTLIYGFIFNTDSGGMLNFVRKNEIEVILLDFLSRELKNIGFDTDYESLSEYEKEIYEKELFDIFDELTDEEKLYLNTI